MIDYFNSEKICLSCNINIKKENQIVCDACHKNELTSEWLDGE